MAVAVLVDGFFDVVLATSIVEGFAADFFFFFFFFLLVFRILVVAVVRGCVPLAAGHADAAAVSHVKEVAESAEPMAAAR